jgi:excisionase family DNA binding protein
MPQPSSIVTQSTTQSTTQRLLTVREAAAYLGVSRWSLREIEWAGKLKRVRIPLSGDGGLRRVLYDRADLDRLIKSWKEAG